MNDRTWNIARATAVLLFVAAVVALPLRADDAPRAVLEQCQNSKESCGTDYPSHWSADSMGVRESNYHEGDVVPFRLVMGGLERGAAYSVVLEWLTSVNGRHGYDYLASTAATEMSADPCAGVGCRLQPVDVPLPADQYLAEYGVGRSVAHRLFLSGGRFVGERERLENRGNLCGVQMCVVAANPTTPVRVGKYESTSTTSMRVWMVAEDTSMVLSWGAHIAAGIDWGRDNTLSGAVRSEYQMRITQFGCSHDARCQADSVVSLQAASVGRSLPSQQGQAPSTALEEELETLLPQAGEVVENPNALADNFDSLFPGEIGTDGTAQPQSDLPGTGSSLENFLMVAGVLLIIGWFLATVAAGNKPRDPEAEHAMEQSPHSQRQAPREGNIREY